MPPVVQNNPTNIRPRVSERIPRLKVIGFLSLIPLVFILPFVAPAFLALLHPSGFLQHRPNDTEHLGLIWFGLYLWSVLGFSLSVASSLIILLARSERFIIHWIYTMIGLNILLAIGLSLVFKTPFIAIGEVFSVYWYWHLYKWLGLNPVVLIQEDNNNNYKV